MQFFLAQVEQGKELVCVYLRASAVNKKSKSVAACVGLCGPVANEKKLV
jgi:hypothetical protein